MNRKLPRFEFKYQMTVNTAREIAKYIQKFGMQADKHASPVDGSYTVTSLYFDSFRLSDYIEKSAGMIHRKKIRMRIYEPYLKNSDYVFFEIKHKHDMTNQKTKIRLSRQEAEDLIKYGTSILARRQWQDGEEEIRNRFLHFLIREPVKPNLIVRYKRQPFMNHDKSLRITFDSGIEACLQRNMSDNKFMEQVSQDIVVMEVKFSYTLPFWLKSVIVKHNLKRDAYSKYANSLEKIYQYNPLLR
jgi:SPX domain protein involved in polyphosphate accumulation